MPGATLSVRVPGYDDIHVVSTSGAGEPISIDDAYGIASVTKTFTAAVALQLVEEGQLSLDEPIERWLPDLPGADQITLDMLLSHTSGLGDVPGQPPIVEPGEAFYYSDVGYAVIGQLIEQVLGQDLATVIDERLTGPLALDDTSLSPTTINDPIRAAAAMTSTSQDLLDWGEALYSGDLLGDDATATMLEMRNVFLFAIFGLGAMGFCDDLIDCTPDKVELVGHSGIGGYPGTTTLLVHDRDTGTTVVIRATVADLYVLEAMVPLTYQALPQSSDTQQT